MRSGRAKTEEFVAGKGVVTRWERQRRQNHWLDALYMACMAANGCGIRLGGEAPKPQPRRGTRIKYPDEDEYSWVRPRPRW